jgi:hypothetical protein
MNIIQTYKIWFYFLAVLFLMSCEREVIPVDPAAFGYEYFPLESGKKYTYQSDSIIFLSIEKRWDTLQSQILEVAGDTFTDLEGRKIYKIDRYFRRDEGQEWRQINTWTAYRDVNKAVRTEENLTFIKLVFPVRNLLRWQGNAMLDSRIKVEVGGSLIEPYEDWKHRIEDVDASYSFKGQDIPALVVGLVDYTDVLSRRKVVEWYGKGIGLLKRQAIIVDLDGNKPSDPWEKKVQAGFIHTLTLLNIE